MLTKIEWHPGELFLRVDFIVTNLPMEPMWMVRFYNYRGTSVTFQMAAVAVTGLMVRTILAAIHRLRAPPSCA